MNNKCQTLAQFLGVDADNLHLEDGVWWLKERTGERSFNLGEGYRIVAHGAKIAYGELLESRVQLERLNRGMVNQYIDIHRVGRYENQSR